MTFFAASLLRINFTTTYTTITTFMRFALDNDALRRVVAVAIRRASRVRRGYIKSSEAAKNSWYYYSLLEIIGFLAVRKIFNDDVAVGGTIENIYPFNNGA